MSDDRLTRIEEKLDRVLDSQGQMNADLRYHIKRTDLLEAQVGTMQKYVYMGLGIAAVLGVMVKALT
jgi:hypothetical protein